MKDFPMINFKENILPTESIQLELKGRIELKFQSSVTAISSILIESGKKEDEIEILVGSELIKIKDLKRCKDNEKYFGTFIESIEEKKGALDAITSFIHDLTKIERSKSGDEYDTIFVTIFLAENAVKNIFIKADNLKLNCGDVLLENLIIKSANLAICCNELFSAKVIGIKSANISGSIYFSQKSSNITLDATNGKIRVIKQVGYDGAFDLEGTHLKVKGLPSILDSNAGLFKARFNNGKIAIE